VESPGEESHSAVEVPAIVRGRRVPARRADKVPAKRRTQQYGASGSDAWEAGGGRLAKQPRSTNTEDGDGVTVFRMPTLPILQLRRECNTREQGHQGTYFTDSPKLATLC